MPKKLTQEEFIKRCKENFGEKKYDYSKCVYINIRSKVIITCFIHGEIKKRPGNIFELKEICSECSKQNQIISKEEFIKRAQEKHGNKYNYKNTLHTHDKTKIVIFCNTCQKEFMQYPFSYLNGNGCKQCFINDMKITKEVFIQRCYKKYLNKFDYSKVNYLDFNEEIIIICPDHGEFLKTPSNFLNFGCILCNGYQIIDNKEKILENKKKFILKAIKKYGDYNDYSEIDYQNSITKIKIICRIHGLYFQTPNIHLSKGCIKCNKNKNINKKKTPFDEFLKRAIEIHKDKYKYSNYDGMKKKLDIICPLHGIFKMFAYAHLRGQECPPCANELRSKNSSKTTEKYIEDAIKVHGNRYDYSLVEYKNNQTLIKIICKTHGIFEMIATNHIHSKNNCPRCYSNYSKKSIDWLNYISKKENINILHAENGGEKMIMLRGKNYKVDGYCLENNTVFEFNKYIIL